MDPWPDALQASIANLDGNAVYAYMNGPTEFDVIGTLVGWDRTADLGRIDGADPHHGRPPRRDPAVLRRDAARGIPDAQVVVLEHSGHISHLEEPETYLRAMREFLSG